MSQRCEPSGCRWNGALRPSRSASVSETTIPPGVYGCVRAPVRPHGAGTVRYGAGRVRRRSRVAGPGWTPRRSVRPMGGPEACGGHAVPTGHRAPGGDGTGAPRRARRVRACVLPAGVTRVRVPPSERRKRSSMKPLRSSSSRTRATRPGGTRVRQAPFMAASTSAWLRLLRSAMDARASKRSSLNSSGQSSRRSGRICDIRHPSVAASPRRAWTAAWSRIASGTTRFGEMGNVSARAPMGVSRKCSRVVRRAPASSDPGTTGEVGGLAEGAFSAFGRHAPWSGRLAVPPRPASCTEIPASTAAVARAVFPRGPRPRATHSGRCSPTPGSPPCSPRRPTARSMRRLDRPRPRARRTSRRIEHDTDDDRVYAEEAGAVQPGRQLCCILPHLVPPLHGEIGGNGIPSSRLRLFVEDERPSATGKDSDEGPSGFTHTVARPGVGPRRRATRVRLGPMGHDGIHPGSHRREIGYPRRFHPALHQF